MAKRADREDGGDLPHKGQRIELRRTHMGVRLRGTVFYSDQLQILVKWDNGRSQSLRPGVDRFRIIE
jgi:hypothetical protein